MAKPLIEVRNLKMYFPVGSSLLASHRKTLKAVDDVSFDLYPGETFGLVGESGCGKTTVGRTLVRLYKPTAGQIIFDGTDIARMDEHTVLPYRKKMQMIFQDPYASLNPRMTVSSIIGEPMRLQGVKQEEISARVSELIEQVGLKKDHLNRYPHEFSGGQRQRIGIARSLAVKPKFVVCDEAVSALDVSIQSQIINLLKDLKDQQNLTYLFITHDLSVVKYISDRIGVMYLGNIVELADAQELFDHPYHPYTEALMNAIPTTDVDSGREIQILEGDIPSPVNPPAGCKFHTRCKYCTEICKHQIPQWREISPNHFVACHHILGGEEETK